jgi:hypothetical protein
VTRRRLRTSLHLLVVTLVCVVVGALLHPATASAATRAGSPPAAQPAPAAPAAPVVQSPLRGVSVPVTRQQAVAWHLPDHPVTTRTPGGSTVVFTPTSGAGEPENIRYRIRWYGYYTIWFNRVETLRIAAGTAACAALVKHIPRVGAILATICALLSVIATYARARNECVLIQGWSPYYPQIARYRGGYCR